MNREGTGELTADKKKKTKREPVDHNVRHPKRAANDPLGEALRSVFDTTVGEAIPAEMLDLLGKLA